MVTLKLKLYVSFLHGKLYKPNRQAEPMQVLTFQN